MSHNCLGCQEDFIPRRNVPNQRFCNNSECQRKRRAQWQHRKLNEDADYREHQKKAKRHWRERHPEYMRTYRQKHPLYRDLDNQQRRKRRARASSSARVVDVAVTQDAVKMDACTNERVAMPIESGYYRLCAVKVGTEGNAVKMDECMCGALVQLFVVKEDSAFLPVHGAAP